MEKEILIDLVQRAQSGNSDAVSTLFDEYKDIVYSIALRETRDRTLADDIVQETFIEVILNIGKLENPAAFSSWLKAVAYHQCTRHYKKKETIHEVAAVESEEGFSVFDTVEEQNAVYIPDEALDQKEFKATILGMINDLPDVQRSALHMFYFEELPLKVIADVQGVSVNTANTRLNRGRLAMKSAITGYEKKHGIRLHSIAFFSFFKWLLSGSQKTMPADSAATVVRNISSGTGVTVTTAEATAAAADIGASAGIAGKFAAMPIITKITAGILAVSMAIGLSVAISKQEKEDSPEISTTETSALLVPETEDSSIGTIPATVPVVTEPPVTDPLAGYHVVIDQYTEAMARNFYNDPETGMPVETDESQTSYLSSELRAASRSYKNYGGGLDEDFLVYYATIDMNSDGSNELLIGGCSEKEDIRIFGLFTLLDNTPVRVIDDYSLGYRILLTIFEDLSFQIYGSGGWAYYGYDYYILEKGKTAPTLLYAYDRDGENTFYYRDEIGNKTRISEEDFLAATDSSNFIEYPLSWTLIPSPAQSEEITKETAEPKEPRVNLVDSFTPAQQRTVNIFLSNFVESHFFPDYPDGTELELLHFAYEHCKLNTGHIEYVENYMSRLSADAVDSTLLRFLGRTISHGSMGNFEYRDGYYYTPAADGEFYGYFAIVKALYRNEDGTYVAEFTTYYGENDYGGYIDNVSQYYGLSASDIADHPELIACYTGIAVMRDYIKSDGSASYQLISMERQRISVESESFDPETQVQNTDNTSNASITEPEETTSTDRDQALKDTLENLGVTEEEHEQWVEAAQTCSHCGGKDGPYHRWIADVTCPNCGAFVPANTCHYC